MEEEYFQQDPSIEINMHIRDLEEKQRLLKERTILIGKTLIDENDRSKTEITKLKKTTLILEQENKRMKEILQHLSNLINNSARKEELSILQRQFDMFRGSK